MTKDEATELLLKGNSRQRLEAARFFADQASADDFDLLQATYRRESVLWTRSALRRAMDRAEHGLRQHRPEPRREDLVRQDLEALALEEATGRLTHEVKPVLGTLRLYAQREIGNFPESRTARELERLGEILQAIEDLGRAAGVPSFQTFNLSELIRDIAAREQEASESSVTVAGRDELIVTADSTLVGMIVRNGLANAIEATSQPDAPVVINWGATDRDYWVAILDEGRGLPARLQNILGIGTTNKKGHMGMGLAIADRAAKSLGGSITLGQREPRGAKFEFRWPKTIRSA